VVAVAAAFALVVGVVGAGIFADGAVPGDPLYSLDLLLEDAWTSFGLPLDPADERAEESRVLAEREDSFVAFAPSVDFVDDGGLLAPPSTGPDAAALPDDEAALDSGTGAGGEPDPSGSGTEPATPPLATPEPDATLLPLGSAAAEARAMEVMASLTPLMPGPPAHANNDGAGKSDTAGSNRQDDEHRPEQTPPPHANNDDAGKSDTAGSKGQGEAAAEGSRGNAAAAGTSEEAPEESGTKGKAGDKGKALGVKEDESGTGE